jgi:hypothetical protein
MRWPFRRREGKLVAVRPVTLTDEEQQECQERWDLLTKGPGGSCSMPEDLIDPFKRSIIAACLMGRAERFLIISADREDYARACESAAKACVIFPLSIFLYDFAMILKKTGRVDDSKAMFRECLRLSRTEKIGPVEEITLRQRDIKSSLLYAEKKLAAGD